MNCFECGQDNKGLKLFQGEYTEPVWMCKECIEVIRFNIERDEFCATYGITYWEAPWA